MSAELKACPFCGGEAVIQSIAKGFGCDDERCVVCQNCFAGGHYRENEEKAIAAWNRRTPEMGLT